MFNMTRHFVDEVGSSSIVKGHSKKKHQRLCLEVQLKLTQRIISECPMIYCKTDNLLSVNCPYIVF